MSLNQVTQPIHDLYTPFLSVPDRKDLVTYAPTTLAHIKAATISSHITSIGKKHTIFCEATFQRNAVASVDDVPIEFNVGLPGFLFPTQANESAVVTKLGANPQITRATQLGLIVRGVGDSSRMNILVVPKTGEPVVVDIKGSADGTAYKIAFSFTAISA